MSKKVYYRQCRLQKGDKHQMSWIPERFAVKDKVIKLRTEGIWEDGWVVKHAYETRREDVEITDSHTCIKNHRKATGDSLPKEK